MSVYLPTFCLHTACLAGWRWLPNGDTQRSSNPQLLFHVAELSLCCDTMQSKVNGQSKSQLINQSEIA